MVNYVMLLMAAAHGHLKRTGITVQHSVMVLTIHTHILECVILGDLLVKMDIIYILKQKGAKNKLVLN